MVRPLGLPVGSVRAVLLLALGARAILVLEAAPHTLDPWFLAVLLLSAASYFAARGAHVHGGQKPRRGPLGLPRGTIRLLFLALVAYGAWLWFHFRSVDVGKEAVVWVLAAYVVGLIVHAIVSRARYDSDLGAKAADHVLSLVTLVCAGGLVWIAAAAAVAPPSWVEPLLGAVVVHYFAAR